MKTRDIQQLHQRSVRANELSVDETMPKVMVSNSSMGTSSSPLPPLQISDFESIGFINGQQQFTGVNTVNDLSNGFSRSRNNSMTEILTEYVTILKKNRGNSITCVDNGTKENGIASIDIISERGKKSKLNRSKILRTELNAVINLKSTQNFGGEVIQSVLLNQSPALHSESNGTSLTSSSIVGNTSGIEVNIANSNPNGLSSKKILRAIHRDTTLTSGIESNGAYPLLTSNENLSKPNSQTSHSPHLNKSSISSSANSIPAIINNTGKPSNLLQLSLKNPSSLHPNLSLSSTPTSNTPTDSFDPPQSNSRTPTATQFNGTDSGPIPLLSQPSPILNLSSHSPEMHNIANRMSSISTVNSSANRPTNAPLLTSHKQALASISINTTTNSHDRSRSTTQSYSEQSITPAIVSTQTFQTALQNSHHANNAHNNNSSFGSTQATVNAPAASTAIMDILLEVKATENDKVVNERLLEAKALNRKPENGAVMHKFSLWSKASGESNYSKESKVIHSIESIFVDNRPTIVSTPTPLTGNYSNANTHTLLPLNIPKQHGSNANQKANSNNSNSNLGNPHQLPPVAQPSHYHTKDSGSISSTTTSPKSRGRKSFFSPLPDSTLTPPMGSEPFPSSSSSGSLDEINNNRAMINMSPSVHLMRETNSNQSSDSNPSVRDGNATGPNEVPESKILHGQGIASIIDASSAIIGHEPKLRGPKALREMVNLKTDGEVRPSSYDLLDNELSEQYDMNSKPPRLEDLNKLSSHNSATSLGYVSSVQDAESVQYSEYFEEDETEFDDGYYDTTVYDDDNPPIYDQDRFVEDNQLLSLDHTAAISYDQDNLLSFNSAVENDNYLLNNGGIEHGNALADGNASKSFDSYHGSRGTGKGLANSLRNRVVGAKQLESPIKPQLHDQIKSNSNDGTMGVSGSDQLKTSKVSNLTAHDIPTEIHRVEKCSVENEAAIIPTTDGSNKHSLRNSSKQYRHQKKKNPTETSLFDKEPQETLITVRNKNSNHLTSKNMRGRGSQRNLVELCILEEEDEENTSVVRAVTSNDESGIQDHPKFNEKEEIPLVRSKSVSSADYTPEPINANAMEAISFMSRSSSSALGETINTSLSAGLKVRPSRSKSERNKNATVLEPSEAVSQHANIVNIETGGSNISVLHSKINRSNNQSARIRRASSDSIASIATEFTTEGPNGSIASIHSNDSMSSVGFTTAILLKSSLEGNRYRYDRDDMAVNSQSSKYKILKSLKGSKKSSFKLPVNHYDNAQDVTKFKLIDTSSTQRNASNESERFNASSSNSASLKVKNIRADFNVQTIGNKSNVPRSTVEVVNLSDEEVDRTREDLTPSPALSELSHVSELEIFDPHYRDRNLNQVAPSSNERSDQMESQLAVFNSNANSLVPFNQEKSMLIAFTQTTEQMEEDHDEVNPFGFKSSSGTKPDREHGVPNLMDSMEELLPAAPLDSKWIAKNEIPPSNHSAMVSPIYNNFNLDSSDSPIQWKRGQPIGEGTFGKVYRGLNEKTGELLAIKQLYLADGTSAEVESLQREISVMWNLDHENIVRYLGTSKTDRNLFIILEYVPGGSIASMLADFGIFSENLIRRFIFQVLCGVNYLHSRGIVHRDIKGANILVTDTGVAKLADFGCSKQLAGMCTTSMEESMKAIRGSVPWMAPEVIKQTGIGRLSDIWSVGATMIEMATGKPPWSEFSNNLATLFHVATSKDPPPIPTNLSVECGDFMSRCLVIDSRGRASAIDLLHNSFLLPELNNASEQQQQTIDQQGSLSTNFMSTATNPTALESNMEIVKKQQQQKR